MRGVIAFLCIVCLFSIAKSQRSAPINVQVGPTFEPGHSAFGPEAIATLTWEQPAGEEPHHFQWTACDIPWCRPKIVSPWIARDKRQVRFGSILFYRKYKLDFKAVFEDGEEFPAATVEFDPGPVVVGPVREVRVEEVGPTSARIVTKRPSEGHGFITAYSATITPSTPVHPPIILDLRYDGDEDQVNEIKDLTPATAYHISLYAYYQFNNEKSQGAPFEVDFTTAA